MDSSVSPDVHFVGLLSGGLKEFEYRKAKGSPAILIHHQDNKLNNVSAILPGLKEILLQYNSYPNNNNNNNSGVLYYVRYSRNDEDQSKYIAF